MRAKRVLKWCGINASVFLAAFGVMALLVWVLPGPMLGLYASWARLLSAAGSRTAGELGSAQAMFLHILTTNCFSAAVYFTLGLLFQAPIVMCASGPFYALISLTAPRTIGRAFDAHDWLLVGAEAAALILAGSVASALAAEAYATPASFRSWLGYWRHNWRRLSTPAVRSWRKVVAEWRWAVLGGLTTVLALMLFVAWFETYGY